MNNVHPLARALLDQIAAWSREKIEGDQAGWTRTQLCRYTRNVPTNRCLDLHQAFQTWDQAGRPLTVENKCHGATRGR